MGGGGGWGVEGVVCLCASVEVISGGVPLSGGLTNRVSLAATLPAADFHDNLTCMVLCTNKNIDSLFL